ncbi:hypothetical protein [Breoghania sp. L-A4]|uniref:hypothetical protein n=1 Tax=Breoghania sp. L-A4 TaxID=2304600 RepID=UPI000E3588C9|nr:hypothetical protein [Breoghania sp. L-A4]AXS41257.1 hypothetical protein D1F64_16030 [Breoghania sp. L-A4]
MKDDISTPNSTRAIAHWRIILAAILDFLTAFFVIGYSVARVSGDTTDDGFKLNGMPALVMFALIVAYFWIGRKYLGGTLWQRLLKAR